MLRIFPRTVGQLCAAALTALSAQAGGSDSYTHTPEAIGALGGSSGSAIYTNVGTAGGFAGTAAGPGGISAKSGFVGQLFEVIGLVLAGIQPSVNEGGALQLTAAQLYDDLTQNPVPPAAVAWSVLAGPIASINPAGLLTATLVYQDTLGSVQGTYAGWNGFLQVAVKNIHNDDYCSYASDGIDDAWQVQYFGQDNPLAGPSADVNGTGQDNRFKFLAGLHPTAASDDPFYLFRVRAKPVAGQPGQREISFDPIVSGRTYTVQFSTDLAAGNWSDLVGFQQPPDTGLTRTVVDVNAGSARRFYRVLITKLPTAPGPAVVQ